VKEKNFDIESKLLGLLRLSESQSAGTEHEAASALEMAIRLAAKHQIKLSELAEKRTEYAATNTWFRAGATTTAKEGDDYIAPEFVQVKRWCDFVEKAGWVRHRRSNDSFEGTIYAYRRPTLMEGEAKLEIRIFDRPWGDIEFEVVRNPDPILGNYAEWMDRIFDCVTLGVTFEDFRQWVGETAWRNPAQPSIPYLNTNV